MINLLKPGFFFLSFLFLMPFGFCQQSYQIQKGVLSKEVMKKDNVRNMSSFRKKDFFTVHDKKSGDTVLLSKNWLAQNPNKVVLVNKDELRISANSSVILVRNEVLIDSILLATKKRFPRPFRPKPRNVLPQSINSSVLEIESFNIVEVEGMTVSGLPKKFIELCFNRRLFNEKVCLMLYFEFKSGEKWQINSGEILPHNLNGSSCLYEEIKYSGGRLGNTSEDIYMKKNKLKKDKIKSVKIEVYDKCWQYDYEKGSVKLISTKEFSDNW